MALKKKTTKEWVYHTSHSYAHGEIKYSVITQLYKIGIYIIVNNDPAMQSSLYPEDIVKIEKKLKKDEKKGIITDLSFGRKITVIEDEEGFYIEKPD